MSILCEASLQWPCGLADTQEPDHLGEGDRGPPGQKKESQRVGNDSAKPQSKAVEYLITYSQ